MKLAVAASVILTSVLLVTARDDDDDKPTGPPAEFWVGLVSSLLVWAGLYGLFWCLCQDWCGTGDEVSEAYLRVEVKGEDGTIFVCGSDTLFRAVSSRSLNSRPVFSSVGLAHASATEQARSGRGSATRTTQVLDETGAVREITSFGLITLFLHSTFKLTAFTLTEAESNGLEQSSFGYGSLRVPVDGGYCCKCSAGDLFDAIVLRHEHDRPTLSVNGLTMVEEQRARQVAEHRTSLYGPPHMFPWETRNVVSLTKPDGVGLSVSVGELVSVMTGRDMVLCGGTLTVQEARDIACWELKRAEHHAVQSATIRNTIRT
jgi:hypothetical protein